MAAIWGRLQSFLTGAAISRASSDAVGPVMEPVRQRSNQRNRVRVLDPGTLGELLAKRWVDSAEGQAEAERSGFNANRLNALALLSQTFPGLGELDRLTNRRLIGDGEARAILRRHGYPEDLITNDDGSDGPLIHLFKDLLSVAEVAAAVQQGHLPNHGGTPDSGPILPSIDPSVPALGGQVRAESPDGAAPSSVPLTQIDLDPVDEASGQGYDLERLRVIANLAGLPPGAAELLTMWNRELIDEDSVDAGLREGHLKTKWSQAWKRMRWNVLGAAEYAGLHLRGWIDAEEMYKGGKLTGHTKDQMDKLYLNRGRPMAPVQAFTAWARGAPHPEGLGYTKRAGTFDEEDFLRALKQSDVRTEYGPVLWHNRFAYPPLFQLGRLAQAGAIDETRVRVILKYERYEPQDIDRLADFWYRGAQTATVNTIERLATTQARAALKRRFMTERIASAGVLTGLELLGSAPAEAGHVLEMWTLERGWIDKPLTPTQIKSAYTRGILTIDEAIAELARQGYSPGTAAALLGTVAPALTTAEIQARIEDDVRNGVVDASEAIDRLKAIGFSTKDAAALVASLTG